MREKLYFIDISYSIVYRIHRIHRIHRISYIIFYFIYQLYILYIYNYTNHNVSRLTTILSSQNLYIKISESRHGDSRDPQIDTPINDSKRYSLIL